jgi:hypothetical protein
MERVVSITLIVTRPDAAITFSDWTGLVEIARTKGAVNETKRGR